MGGDPAYNAAALRALLDGAPGAYRDAVVLNAAGALVVAGASQITAVQLLADGVPIVIVLISALAVNLRMAMYSAAP